MLATDIRNPPLPPENIRSWILARVISVIALADSLAEQNEPSPGPLSKELVEQLLIHEWNGALRDRWPLLMDLSGYE